MLPCNTVCSDTSDSVLNKLKTKHTKYQVSNIKYQNDIRWVSQNITLYYGVRCQKIDNMFRPFFYLTHLISFWYLIL